MVFGLLDLLSFGNIAQLFDDQLGTTKLYSAGAGWDLGLRLGSVCKVCHVFSD
jgi:hypothetical protein